MLRYAFILLALFHIQGFCQTVPEQQAPPIQITPLPPGMSALEFTKLQRSLNWKRIFAASFIPGYIHFYAGHKKYAWGIAGVRAIGFGMIGYSIIDELNHTDKFSLSFSGASDSVSAYKARSRRNLYLFLSGIALNMIGYALDWAHGDFIIEQERNAVLYKFGKRWGVNNAAGFWYDPRRRAFGPTLRIPL